MGFFDNIESIETKGLELEFEGRFTRGLRSRISYSIQHSEDATTGLVLAGAPKRLAKLNLIAPIYLEKIFTGLELQHLSGRKTLLGNDSGDYLLANLTLFSHELVRGLELSASVYNLFDKKYFHSGSPEHLQDRIQQDGRTFQIKANYRF